MGLGATDIGAGRADLLLPLALIASCPIPSFVFFSCAAVFVGFMVGGGSGLGDFGGGSDFAALLDLVAILCCSGFRVPTVLARIGVPAPPGGGGGWLLPPVVSGSAGGGAGFLPSMICVTYVCGL